MYASETKGERVICCGGHSERKRESRGEAACFSQFIPNASVAGDATHTNRSPPLSMRAWMRVVGATWTTEGWTRLFCRKRESVAWRNGKGAEGD